MRLRCLRLCACAASSLTSPARVRAADEERFVSPQAAVDALRTAAEARDTNSLHAIFGPEAHGMVSADVVEAATEREVFINRIKEKVNLVSESDRHDVIRLGTDGWPFPIPLVKEGGQWYFDSAAGREEILNRRIGANELGTINVCLAYVDAQREYAAMDRNGDGILEYAPRLRSTPGTHDGLYWPPQAGEDLSPLGPLIAQAHIEGYRHETKIMTDEQSSPYHGYFFRILTRQGKNAPGGKYNYLINGHLMGGFAFVAWPAEWGNTGVMTFIVNQRGNVFQKNLGSRTSAIASSMTTYNPDSSWKPAVWK